eukprot:XP_022276961.1 uncharacterized protein LOC102155752 isoform X1 [Canis lupus familiaris]
MLSHFAGSGLPELHICPLTALCAPTLSSRGKRLEGCTCWVDAQAPAARRAPVLEASIVVHKPTSLHNSPVATPQTLRGSALCFQPGRAPASLPPPLVSPNSSSHISVLRENTGQTLGPSSEWTQNGASKPCRPGVCQEIPESCLPLSGDVLPKVLWRSVLQKYRWLDVANLRVKASIHPRKEGIDLDSHPRLGQARPPLFSIFQRAWKLGGTAPNFAKVQSGPQEGHVKGPESGS